MDHPVRTFRRSALAFLTAVLAAAAGLRLASALGVDALGGGAFVMSMLWPTAGAGTGTASGGALTLKYAIGAPSAPMSGGSYSVAPGPIGAVNAAAADSSLAHAYPTPFKPSLGHDRITFSRLPPQAKVEVYALDGRRVKTLTKDDVTGSLVWLPVANEQGQAVASGVYLFVVTSPGLPVKRGKLMIIR